MISANAKSRVLLVDDSSEAYGRQVQTLTSGGWVVEVMHHNAFLAALPSVTGTESTRTLQRARDIAKDFFEPYQLLLVDAFDPSRNFNLDTSRYLVTGPLQETVELPRSLFAGLDAIHGLIRTTRSKERPPVVAYSSRMERPEVNIPLRELFPVVVARYRAVDLLGTWEDGEPVLRHVVEGRYHNAWRDPVNEDYAALGIPPTARLVDLVEKFERDREVWFRVVTNSTPAGVLPGTVSKRIARWSRESLGETIGGSTRATNLVRVVSQVA
jgi:hypothetical protein